VPSSSILQLKILDISLLKMLFKQVSIAISYTNISVEAVVTAVNARKQENESTAKLLQMESGL
jgi:hypothetical protein